MASNPPPSLTSSKTTNAPPPSSIATSSQAAASSGSDSHSQRRAGGAGSFGAGSQTRIGGGAPRNKQASRNQHKQSRRYKLTDEDAMAESAAMKSTSSRKGQTSITHLMNFSLPPRPSHFHQHVNHNIRTARKNPTWGLGSGYHAVDKARYVHANYRFVVDPRGNYHAQSVDADVYLDWNSVLQILASPISQAAACPICLGDPVAPRMAKCGHIFCLHCLIRYMHSTDETDHNYYADKRARWKKCPICWDSVYLSETRPVRWYTGQERATPREGEDIVLRLVMRPARSTLALPREGSLAKEDEIPWHFAADVMDYSRVMKGTEDYMMSQFDDEIEELEQLERHDELMFGEDTEWTGRAIRGIKDAKERCKGIGNSPRSAEKPEESRQRRVPVSSHDVGVPTPHIDLAQHGTSAHESTNIELSTAAAPPATSNQAPSSALSSSLAQFRARMGQPHPPSDYYFYQALLHYYLSPLDIRILKAAFGDYSTFPSTILPRVERISNGHVIDDDVRKRTKYLAHLPYGCEVNFLECDWTDTVPAEILEKFKSEIERRRKRNLDKEAKEEKERIKAEKEEEDKRYAAARRKRPSSPEEKFKPQDFQPLGSAEPSASPEAADFNVGSTSPLWSARRPNGSSFASLASPSTSPSASRTVWGTTAIAPVSPILHAAPSEPQPMDDGWLQGWEKDLLREDDLTAQLEATALGGETASKPPSGQGKKKKGKKITLMSTNARRGA